jgi:hypothetical protein
MSKYTPGPWGVERDSMLDWHILCKSNVPNVPGVVARVGFEPNARLIASAPELLEACKEAIGRIADHDKDCPLWLLEKWQRIVSKAEGGSNC